MPRIAEARQPAEPTSPDQRERHRRILRVAARHGAAKGLDGVQMHEVAKDAEVAIATLYRYFPSKTHLFTALMCAEVEGMQRQVASTAQPEDPVEAVSELLVSASHQLLAQPLLAQAMLQSNNAAIAGSDVGVTQVFGELMRTTMGVAEPDERQQRLIRILEATWYGLLISALNRHLTAQEAGEDIRLACQRLLSRGESDGSGDRPAGRVVRSDRDDH